ncbi:MAG: IS21 family transposase [Planctomycetaceae bacterium]|nr:IS21 family transposase [Planctomycetaceae bacterium]MBV8311744.1 IS21 family transposase [Planctomycetaceae bacterium]
MEERSKCGKVGLAAAKADVHRNTATKYLKAGRLPSEIAVPRTWRTRKDPFEEHWEAEILPRLVDAPELEALMLLELLIERHPGHYELAHLRTLQRRIREWRAQYGPPKEIFFAQEHRPGEAMQTDFTWATELGITIAGEPFPHMLCHPVLPYSNWEWATICHSESIMALRKGVQAAVFRLGKVPQWHQTDNSTGATHRPSAEETAEGERRKFNADYEALMRHLGMKPRTIEIAKKNQNGDVEALNGALKRRLAQHLAMRGSRDFDSVYEYEKWLECVLEKANRLREARLKEELAVMAELRVSALPEYREYRDVTVSSWSTIRVLKNSYSVPSRLIGEPVMVRAYDDRLSVFYMGKHQMDVERLLGENKHRINYRHVIWWLVRKPGAFPRYRYREEMFPTVTFRKAYDRLCEQLTESSADLNYLRILHLAASTMENEVELALQVFLEQGQRPMFDDVKALVAPEKPSVPALTPLAPDLTTYDKLLACGGEA